jgi:hypothetical protein
LFRCDVDVLTKIRTCDREPKRVAAVSRVLLNCWDRSVVPCDFPRSRRWIGPLLFASAPRKLAALSVHPIFSEISPMIVSMATTIASVYWSASDSSEPLCVSPTHSVLPSSIVLTIAVSFGLLFSIIAVCESMAWSSSTNSQTAHDYVQLRTRT